MNAVYETTGHEPFAPPADELPRLLAVPAAGPGGLAVHRDAYGPVPAAGGVLALVDAAGLTGRGGAAFPAARKLAAVAAARRRPVVVGNGGEGEPAAAKDLLLLHTVPHLVLDGLMLAAEAVGASDTYLYVERDSPASRAVTTAVRERRKAGIDARRVQIVHAPPRFLAGEESALVNRVSGGPAMPRDTPPRVFERGVRGRPTLVHNVETLAQIALIARYGPEWFRALGTAAEPGTMLFSVGGAVAAPRVVEAEIGVSLAALLDAAGGLTGRVQAILYGGYHGGWLPAADAFALPLANAALRPRGVSLGAGVVVALPADACGVVETARVARYLADESAKQCGPCLNGLPRIAEALDMLARPHPDRRTRAWIERWSALVAGRGACHHPDGTVRFVRSALRVFAREIDLHEAGRCSAATARVVLPVPAAGVPAPRDWR
jgi:NADH:ubiquinone oxidoreductase subunit F (NADH-binding)